MLIPIDTPCPKCGAPVVIKVSNQPMIINGPYVSMVVLQHPTHSVCAKCGLTVAPAISGIPNMQAVAQPVFEREQEQRVIEVPNAARIGNA